MAKKPMTAAEIGRKGGKARARKMSKAQRSEAARHAGQHRWSKVKGE